MITLTVDYLKAALLFASNEETRYYLKGVHLLRRGDHLRIAATDGHRLFVASEILAEPGPDFDVILPRDALKKALTGLGRGVTHLPLVLETGERAGRDQVLRATLGDLQMAPVDGSFPDITRVVPNADAITGEVAAFNPMYLADIGKAAKILGSSVTDFHLAHNGDAPALITFGQKTAFAALMPRRPTVEPMRAFEVAAILGRDAPAVADQNVA